jgi:GT2 family glycosyltransferase
MPALISIVIKTYNEEAKIARAIESALRAGELLQRPVEVVIADSLSTDRTAEIAAAYPVRIVQFLHAEERGCGAGVELGFQHARGCYIYFLDGDMELDAGFVVAALARIEQQPRLAGIGGIIEDTRIANDVDRIRVNNQAVSAVGPCRWLEGGGLYRRSAIVEAGGYAANRNLKGYEEAELGMRLRAAGWQLERLPGLAARHTGHEAGTWELMKRHWRSGRAMSGGVLLRSALGRPWLGEACRMLLHPLAVIAWWLLLAAGLIAVPGAASQLLLGWGLASLLLALALLAVKRDLRHAITSILSWHYGAAALVLGMLDTVRPVHDRIAARILAEPAEPAA